MSFMMFTLLFTGLVLALLAVTGGLVVRHLSRKRQLGVSQPPREAAPQRRKPSLAKKAPEPESDAAAPIRRRQLHSFAEAERSAAEADAVVLPVPAPVPEPAIEPETEAEAPATPYEQAVLGRLEAAFEALQAEDITLGAYRTRILAEQATVEERIAALQAGEDSGDLEGTLAAREAVLWCLDWADEQADAQRS